MNGRKRKICERKRRKIYSLSRFDFSGFTTALERLTNRSLLTVPTCVTTHLRGLIEIAYVFIFNLGEKKLSVWFIKSACLFDWYKLKSI